MTPFFYPARNNWRVQIPASDSVTGKRTSRFFPTKEKAERFIQEHYKAGSVQLAVSESEAGYADGMLGTSLWLLLFWDLIRK